MAFIAITGGIASGKTQVGKFLKNRHGLDVINADDISHEISDGDEAREAISAVFGKGLYSSGKLDRKSLAEIVFRDEGKLRELEQILHPRVAAEVSNRREALEREGRSIVFFDCPLLFEAGMQSLVDKVLLVYCDQETQLDRLIRYRHMPAEEAALRIAAQKPIDEKVNLCDYILYNDSNMEDLREGVSAFVDILREELALA